MRTILYSESPMNPLAIARQLYEAGLAFEKHHWTFPNTYYSFPVSLLEYAPGNFTVPGPALKEKFIPDPWGNPEAATPLMDYLSPDANPQPPLHFTLLYEESLSPKRRESNARVEQSLVWRFLEAAKIPLHLVFSRRAIAPLDQAPKSTLQLVETILGYAWTGENKPGIVPLVDSETRQRALLALGVKSFNSLYLLAGIPEFDSQVLNASVDLPPDILDTLKSLTEVDSKIYYPSFYSLVSQCDWIMTTHSLLPEHVPFCFYSSQDLRSTLRQIHQQTAREDDRELIEVTDISALPRQPEQLQNVTLSPQTAQWTGIKIAQGVYVSDILPLETLAGATEISLAWTGVTRIEELLQFQSLKYLNLDGIPFLDIATLSQMTWLESLSLKQVQINTLTPLVSLKKLKHLAISRMPFQGLTPLADLASLESLSLDRMKVTDLSPILGSPLLNNLSLDDTNLENLKDISKIKKLNYLSLRRTKINDLRHLSSLQSLKHLVLSETKITDVTPVGYVEKLKVLEAEGLSVKAWSAIQNLRNLDTLKLSYSDVSDLSFINFLENLRILEINKTEVVDLSPLQESANLRKLSLYGTPVLDISPLSELTNLQDLDLSETYLPDYSPLSNICSLEYLYFNYTPVENITWLRKLKRLKDLRLPGTRITDISVLENLQSLEVLDLSDCKIRDVSALVHLQKLQKLDLRGTVIEDFSPLLQLPRIKELKINTKVINADIYNLLLQRHNLIEPSD